MTPIRRGSAKKLHDARRAWLLLHQELYLDVPGIHDDVTDAGRVQLNLLHASMKQLGLFGSSTIAMQRECIRRLVSELRGERVDVGW